MERSMTMVEAYKNFWRNTFKMRGRARRKEYWVPTLLHIGLMILISIAATMIDNAMGYSYEQEGPFSTWSQIILGLLLFIPAFTVTARRLQDININGWWALLPNFGGIFIIIGLVILFLITSMAGSENIIFIIIIFLCYIIMLLVFLVFTLLDGNPYSNKFGPDPKGRDYER